MKQTLLQDLILAGQPGTVTYRGKSMPNLFSTALSSWLDVVCEVYNSHAIPRLFRLNGWSTESMPELKHGSVEAVDIAALADYISKVSAAGFEWARDSQIDSHLRREAGLPPARKTPAAPAEESADNEGGGAESPVAPKQGRLRFMEEGR